ncbi:Serine carboxypeptidase-like 20 [Camellia lanceoleosa]|uniref:Serine carboxypeptidase-like 20 n=1 Tax=Camellia lanceoleosa TaxID=1840588 RepID=A0ACC0G674_9ERIC|nr:Serine carboxypeptidase-like 20 [Camellia lanceoleosa]
MLLTDIAYLDPGEAVPANSLITKLPGFNATFPSKHYSGYVSIDGNPAKQLFFYFVKSERKPSNDLVVLWLNGVPGCSSFDGFVYEHGLKHHYITSITHYTYNQREISKLR